MTPTPAPPVCTECGQPVKPWHPARVWTETRSGGPPGNRSHWLITYHAHRDPTDCPPTPPRYWRVSGEDLAAPVVVTARSEDLAAADAAGWSWSRRMVEMVTTEPVTWVCALDYGETGLYRTAGGRRYALTEMPDRLIADYPDAPHLILTAPPTLTDRKEPAR